MVYYGMCNSYIDWYTVLNVLLRSRRCHFTSICNRAGWKINKPVLFEENFQPVFKFKASWIVSINCKPFPHIICFLMVEVCWTNTSNYLIYGPLLWGTIDYCNASPILKCWLLSRYIYSTMTDIKEVDILKVIWLVEISYKSLQMYLLLAAQKSLC